MCFFSCVKAQFQLRANSLTHSRYAGICCWIANVIILKKWHAGSVFFQDYASFRFLQPRLEIFFKHCLRETVELIVIFEAILLSYNSLLYPFQRSCFFGAFGMLCPFSRHLILTFSKFRVIIRICYIIYCIFSRKNLCEFAGV